jgi:hypothetical protein
MDNYIHRDKITPMSLCLCKRKKGNKIAVDKPAPLAVPVPLFFAWPVQAIQESTHEESTECMHSKAKRELETRCREKERNLFTYKDRTRQPFPLFMRNLRSATHPIAQRMDKNGVRSES